jgi:hypothetical protein
MLIVNPDNPEKTCVTIMNIAEQILSDLNVIKCAGQAYLIAHGIFIHDF